MSDIKTSIQVNEEEIIELPPPSYNDIVQLSPSFYHPPSFSADSFKPIVIPQISHHFGAFSSPFARAYSPLLLQPPKGEAITAKEFLLFLDGLNEVFIAAPAFQATALIGMFVSMVPLPVVPLIGIGLSAATGLMSAATSLAMSKAYVKAANEHIFSPRGLKCKVLKTKKMMLAVGDRRKLLDLPPLGTKESLENGGTYGEMDDPKMRRIRALGNKVAPLTFTGLPEPETMDGWWKLLGSKEAQKQDAKMHVRLMKERENLNYQSEINGRNASCSQMEQNIAQKIYWIVIDIADNPGGEAEVEEDSDGPDER